MNSLRTQGIIDGGNGMGQRELWEKA